MDISKNFSNSISQLWKNKIVVIPLLLPTVFSLLAITIVLLASGYFGTAVGFYKLYGEYQKEYPALIKNDEYNSQFMDYAKTKGFEIPDDAFSPRNILLLVFLVCLLLIFTYLCNLSAFAMMAAIVKKKRLDWKSQAKAGIKKFFTLIWGAVLSVLLILVPLIGGIILIALSAMMPKLLSILSIIAIIAVMVILIFYVILRTFFVLPIIFLEDKSGINSVKESFRVTRGKWKKVLAVFAIIIAISIAFAIATSGLGLFETLLSTGALFALSILFGIIVTVLQAFISAFESLFLFNSYLDIKRQKV